MKRRVGAFGALLAIDLILLSLLLLLLLPLQRSTATVTIGARQEGSVLTVSGRTDLPDGVILRVGVQDMDLESQSRHIDLTTTVTGGRYSIDLSLVGWPAHEVLVTTSFAPSDPGQPSAVVARFGADGAGLSGPGVGTSSDGGKYLETSIELKLGPP
jgi:hypothetical protein